MRFNLKNSFTNRDVKIHTNNFFFLKYMVMLNHVQNLSFYFIKNTQFLYRNLVNPELANILKSVKYLIQFIALSMSREYEVNYDYHFKITIH